LCGARGRSKTAAAAHTNARYAIRPTSPILTGVLVQANLIGAAPAKRRSRRSSAGTPTVRRHTIITAPQIEV